jgi:type I restriction enzyme S subunit
VRLKNVSNIVKGQQKNKDSLSDDGEFPVFNGGINPSGFTNSFNRQGNKIAISEGGNSCGYVQYIKKKFWSGGHNYTLDLLNENVLDIFVFYQLKNNENKIMSLRVGSGLPNIQKKTLENFIIVIPKNLEEQNAIANILETCDKEISLQEKKLSALKEQKKGLMQVLLTGKVRLKVED